jgi:general secretion pathway protein D
MPISTSRLRSPSLARLLNLSIGILLASLASLSQAANNDEMTLNLVGADIESAVKAIAEISGRNFLIDPRVKGNVNIISGKPVSRALTYQILVSALRLQGFSVIEGAHVTKILPEADAKSQAGPLATPGTARGDQVMTEVFTIRYQSAAQLIGVLKPLVSANQSIAADTGSNTLLITDSADNLRRLEKIIASIDLPRGDEPLIVALRHASAVDVAANLNRLYVGAGGTGGSGQGSLIAIADPRGNRVIVRADNPGQLSKAAGLISEMDQAGSGLGNIRVVYLKHAEAAKVAQTLRAILATDGNTAGTATATSAGSLSTLSASSAAGSSSTPTFSSNNNQAALVPGSMIQADTASNALIITAPEAVFNNLRNVIEMLDRRRAQVYIEALIVELSAESAAEYGVQWQNLSGLSKSSLSVFGGTNFGSSGNNIITASQSIAGVGTGFNFGISNGTVNIPGVGTISNLGVLAHLLESQVNANILSTPNILTLDNEEAKIIIGKNVPFVTGSYTTTSTTSTTPFQTYERKDVGLTLKVKPQISAGGGVRIQIFQEASSVVDSTASNTAGPTTKKRSMESNVLVDDGNIIVLGGLIEDSSSDSEERVPILGSLPYVGSLFRYRSRDHAKTNMMVFLRPHIVRDSNAYQAFSDERYDMLLGKHQEIPANAVGWRNGAPPGNALAAPEEPAAIVPQ